MVTKIHFDGSKELTIVHSPKLSKQIQKIKWHSEGEEADVEDEAEGVRDSTQSVEAAFASSIHTGYHF